MALKILLKESNGVNLPASPAGYKYIYADTNGSISEREDTFNSPIGAYKEWTAEIRQSGTNNPVLNVIKNTLGVTITAVRGGVGQYLLSGFISPIDASNLLTSNNFIIERHLSLASYLDNVVFTSESQSSVGIGTYNTDTFTDGILISTDTLSSYISIKVYNL